MKITYDWLKDYLQTKNSENQLLDKLTDLGLEVEQIENTSTDESWRYGTFRADVNQDGRR